ncbi:MAG: NRAMP family divalent metal transporter [Candidatus Sulfotelmatobacter sp.]
MKNILGITLGIMTALGGFVDLGQIVFTTQAGALFGYQLMWAIALGTAAIIIYMEMCGRVAVVAKEPVFAVVHTRLGKKLGLAALIASNLLNLITCAAEIGGIAILLHLLTGWPEKLLLVATTLALGMMVLLFRFQWIERTLGLSGLMMIVFAASAVTLHPDWGQLAHGLIPKVSEPDTKHTVLYWYFAVGIFSAMLMEYEVHFYSSGAIEEDWTPKDLAENFMVAALGSLLGSLLTVGLLALGVILFLPRAIFPQTLSTAVFSGAFPFAQKALIAAIAGCLACLAGATVETALSGGYNVCQFFNLKWGKNVPPRSAPVFTGTWVAMFTLAMVIALTGVRPLQLVNISIVFGMVVMPFTYYPVLRTASDKNVMGKHVNRKFDDVMGGIVLVFVIIAALAAIPLMVLTHSGRP